MRDRDAVQPRLPSRYVKRSLIYLMPFTQRKERERERERMVSILACKSPRARLFGIEIFYQGRSVTVIIKISNLKHRADRVNGIRQPLLRKGVRVSLLFSRPDRGAHRANVSLLLPIGSFLFLISGSRAVYYYVNCYQATIIKLIVSRTTTGQKPIRSAEFLDPPNSRCFHPPLPPPRFSRAQVITEEK